MLIGKPPFDITSLSLSVALLGTALVADAGLHPPMGDPAKYLPALAATSGYHGLSGAISFDDKGDIRNGAVTTGGRAGRPAANGRWSRGAALRAAPRRGTSRLRSSGETSSPRRAIGIVIEP